MSSFELERFVDAQDRGGTYEKALAELQAGRKRGHWIWFVFPQIAGLGRSPTAQEYAVTSLAEAKAYLEHPVLGPRLLEAAGALSDLAGSDPEAVLGGIDALKLRSSMTLFLRAAEALSGDGGAGAVLQGAGAALQRVLDQYYGGQPDPATDRLLNA